MGWDPEVEASRVDWDGGVVPECFSIGSVCVCVSGDTLISHQPLLEPGLNQHVFGREGVRDF